MDFNMYKMRIDTRADDDADPIDFCREKRIVGVGHEIYMDRFYDELDEVKQAHWDYEAEFYNADDRSRFRKDGEFAAELRYLFEEIEEGDYIWINRSNDFYLCRAEGEWGVAANQPEQDQEEYIKNDIHNFHNAEWKNIPYQFVPGFVQRQFSQRFGTIARMRDSINDTTRAITHELFQNDDFQDLENPRSARTFIEKSSSEDILNLLGPQATEDLVLLYLQDQGWKLVKSSLSDTQAEIEGSLRRGDEHAVVQVKSGKASVNPDKYQKYTGRSTVFLFVGEELDLGSYSDIKQIPPEAVTNYLRENIEEVPREILSEFGIANS